MRATLRAFVRWTSYPAVLCGSVAAAWALIAQGLSPAVTVALVGAAVALTIALLERLWPYRAEWNRSHGDVKTDTLHLLLAMIPVPILFRAAALGALTAGAAWLAKVAGTSLWPTQLPLAVQLLLALVVAELGQYWVHRLAHERQALWRLHSVHHSAERLYWLNAGRFHPVDTLLQHASEVAPLILLGASPELLALFTVFTSANGLLRHANIDLRTGALSYVLSTADLHRWHHSVHPEESNSNYGANLILWDVVFGTRLTPAPEGPGRLGLELKAFPRDFLQLLLVPMRWRW